MSRVLPFVFLSASPSICRELAKIGLSRAKKALLHKKGESITPCCETCGEAMVDYSAVLISCETDSAPPSQWDVWFCPICGFSKARAVASWRIALRRCSSCGKRGQRLETKMIRRASCTCPGKIEMSYTCKHCGEVESEYCYVPLRVLNPPSRTGTAPPLVREACSPELLS